MLKRKVTHYIKKWVDSKNKKCLVIQGARQTGKTYIVERFAEENYEEIVEINFKQIVPLFSTEGYVICDTNPEEDLMTDETVSLYDEVVIEGTDLYDGKVIR